MKCLSFHSSLQLIQQVLLQQLRETCLNELIQLSDRLIDLEAPLIAGQMPIPSWQSLLIFVLLLILDFQPARAIPHSIKGNVPSTGICILWPDFSYVKTCSYKLLFGGLLAGWQAFESPSIIYHWLSSTLGQQGEPRPTAEQREKGKRWLEFECWEAMI